MKANINLLKVGFQGQSVRLLVLLMVMSLTLTACGKQEQIQKQASTSPQEIEIHYQADDGEFDTNLFDKVQNKINSKDDLKEDKTIITLASNAAENSMLDYWITSFNMDNSKYYVERSIIPEGNELQDIRNKLYIEVGTGGGPDILASDVFPVSQEIIDSGVLVDLTSYLESSDITEEKYYPSYKAYESAGKIFGVSPDVQIQLMLLDSRVLGTTEIPDMKTLLEKLLVYSEKACFHLGWNEYMIMQYFMTGSEDIWGMVDWEEGECDFSGELFSNMLEVAKKYGANCETGFEPVMEVIRPMPERFDGQKGIEEQGKIMVNHYFEDGNFPVYYTSYTYAINANSKEVEGAWAFLSYMMSKKGQNLILSPVHREMSQKVLEGDYRLIEEGKVYTSINGGPDMQVKLADDADILLEELVTLYGNGRRPSSKAEEIHYIIYEEAGSYFSGDKSKEEVVEVIESRVNLYLSELK